MREGPASAIERRFEQNRLLVHGLEAHSRFRSSPALSASPSFATSDQRNPCYSPLFGCFSSARACAFGKTPYSPAGRACCWESSVGRYPVQKKPDSPSIEDIKAIASATSTDGSMESFGQESAVARPREESLLAVGREPVDASGISNVSTAGFSLAQTKRKKILHLAVPEGQRREETRLRKGLDRDNNAVLNAAGEGTLTTPAQEMGSAMYALPAGRAQEVLRWIVDQGNWHFDCEPHGHDVQRRTSLPRRRACLLSWTLRGCYQPVSSRPQ